MVKATFLFKNCYLGTITTQNSYSVCPVAPSMSFSFCIYCGKDTIYMYTLTHGLCIGAFCYEEQEVGKGGYYPVYYLCPSCIKGYLKELYYK